MPIQIKNLSHTYNDHSSLAFRAIEDITCTLQEDRVTAIIGETGSGKTTFIQHLNGLLLPTAGELNIQGYTIIAGEKPKGLKGLRSKVGIVFQFPEYQLFEETVLSDVMFGPLNFQVNKEDAEKKAREALSFVGISEELFLRSPFELSGGQKRRVAIAGIIAMDPGVIILDEPTAGLDPQGAKEMMALFVELHKKGKMIVMVTHDMEHVLTYCDDVLLMQQGKLLKHYDVESFVCDKEQLQALDITPPMVVQLQEELEKKGITFPKRMLSLDEIATYLKEVLS